ncbi:hypothetical protein NNJEOMEG_00408 [Fundidesulfovibrio magnetotacticus]|uniref:Uncharacterized protein n=1 Tax=Fundidesulfovibrio magnetotacticus TaxID=2730080 RepID=A0A6V8LIP1_9BACT|nr:hypothetical protein [Fundidesulfovibrio magnetotacticus]GFK92583.1 hypothetical protein NNJEOMEG_00408 [Fundidesulfovibrio magnetotacticus]
MPRTAPLALVLAVLVLVLLAFTPPSAQAQAQAQERRWLPAQLAPWEGWALHGQDEALCPPLAQDPTRRQCLFPTWLSVAADGSGAGFSMVWRVFSPSLVSLPWGQGLWPEDVKVFGKPVPVLDAGGVPGVRLEPGEWQVTGRLSWKSRPAFLNVPPRTGLVELVLDRAPVAAPRLSGDGRLELAAPGSAAVPAGDSLRVNVLRLLRDGVPVRMVTLARLDVSGRARTLELDGLLLPGTEPLAVRSPVPVGFGPDGRVSVLAGAGRHEVEIESRFTGDPASVGPLRLPFGPEVWAFAPDAPLREALLSGLPPVDPKTTDLPAAWKRHQAYAASDGATLVLATARRGEPPAQGQGPSLARRLWLDPDGRGFTVQDRLEGRLGGSGDRGWTLAMTPPGELGRATLDGRDQPVVLLGGEGGVARGVVLRRAELNLTAESRSPGRGAALPASGWDARVSSLSAVLELPPGWSLLAASGPERAEGSWADGWSLMDIFLALFIPLCAWKLGRPLAGGALLAFLAVSLHEQGAPVWQWLPLLAALALERGFARMSGGARMAGFLKTLAVALLAVTALPFALEQARFGLHPQLEELSGPTPWEAQGVRRKAAPARAPAPAPALQATGAQKPDASAPEASGPEGASLALRMQEAAPSEEQPAAPSPPAPPAVKPSPPGGRAGLEQDPNSLVQTGPGLPLWRWREVRLSWTGPVEPSERLSLVLVPPVVNAFLHLARAALILAALGLLTVRGKASPRAAAVAACLLALLASPAQAGDIPSKDMLDELRARLLRPAECQPHCAGVSRLGVALDAQTLTMTVWAGAAARLALPLPGAGDGWRPRQVSVDGRPAAVLFLDGVACVLLEPGAHTVVLAGPAPSGASFTISSPVPPKLAEARAPGWSVLGIGPDGALEGGLRFTRRQDPAASGKDAPGALASAVPPFLEVERSLELGLTWSAVTTVRRLSGGGEPLSVPVPLLPGETVTGQGVRVEDGRAVAVLAAGQERVSWRSRLDVIPSLELKAPQGVDWVESWKLSASPVWEVRFAGVVPVATRDAQGRFAPFWRPWPGESVTLAVTRPAPAPGESLTIDAARLKASPGERSEEAVLELRLRSALGGRHVLRLPPDAQVTGVTLGGRPASWTPGPGGELALTLPPGASEPRVSWRQEARGLWRATLPAVDLGHPAANARLQLELPRDRLTLFVWGDTPFAPAVTLWGTLAGVALAATLLGRIPWTPLRFRHWLLLGLGLSQTQPEVAAAAVAWLLALGWRRGHAPAGRFGFDLLQTLLAVTVLAGLACLFEAVRSGLLGDPALAVTGNGSTPWSLAWDFGRVPGELPDAGAFTVPAWWRRGLMLAWSMWLAWSLSGWLRWGWECYSEGGVWRRPVFSWPWRRGASGREAPAGSAPGGVTQGSPPPDKGEPRS